MRTLEALKKLVAKVASGTVSGNTVDEVIDYAAEHLDVTATGLVLTAPDESVWDISIANDGTISGTKRT